MDDLPPTTDDLPPTIAWTPPPAAVPDPPPPPAGTPSPPAVVSPAPRAPDPRLDGMLAGLDRMRMAGLVTETEYHRRYAALAARYGNGSSIPAPMAAGGGASRPVQPWRPDPGTSSSPPLVADAPTSPGPAPVPTSAARAGRSMAAIAVVTAVVVVVVGVVGVRQVLHRNDPPAGKVAFDPSAPFVEPTSLQQFIPIAKGFVAGHRGLDFKRDVPVSFLNDADFEKKFLAGNPTQSIDKQAVADTEKVYKAMHLIEPSVDLAALVQQTGALGVEGFYDVREKALYVRGTSPTPYVRQVLIHELTHALQDQNYGLDRALPPSRSAESGLAFLALAEGDARRVENEYVATEPAADQDQARTASLGTPAEQAAAKLLPRVFLEYGQFPYVSGEQFVTALATGGGEAAVNQAFQQPPTTSAQILDPRLYITGGGYGRVAVPATPVDPFDGGIWGGIGYKLIFDHLVQQGAMAPGDAAAATRSWGGDVWLAWTQGSQACWRDVVSPSSAGTRAALSAGLNAYVAANKGAVTLQGTGPFQITACT